MKPIATDTLEWEKLVTHPIADVFPMMTTEEQSELLQSIRTDGYIADKPIVLFEGKILDGRNRHQVCFAERIKPTLAEFEPVKDGDPFMYVLRENLIRRHLDTGQRAMVAADMAKLRAGRPSETAGIPAVSQSEAAKIAGVSRDSVQTARKISEASPELAAAVKAGKRKLHSAEQEVKRCKQPTAPATVQEEPTETETANVSTPLPASSDENRDVAPSAQDQEAVSTPQTDAEEATQLLLDVAREFGRFFQCVQDDSGCSWAPGAYIAKRPEYHKAHGSIDDALGTAARELFAAEQGIAPQMKGKVEKFLGKWKRAEKARRKRLKEEWEEVHPRKAKPEEKPAVAESQSDQSGDGAAEPEPHRAVEAEPSPAETAPESAPSS